MDKLTLNIYDNDGNLVRVAEGHVPRIKFGVVRALMEILNISDSASTFDVLKNVYDAWDKVTGLLGTMFEDVTAEEWDNVDVSDLVPLTLGIMRHAMEKMNGVPTDPKNSLGA